mmetsp:Transcript_7933/g.21711  ORF Transcript_7933/g.21711 Transcript_7933/m.21711 type:complete len:285 (-) Transcript_7933:854-1708(-)
MHFVQVGDSADMVWWSRGVGAGGSCAVAGDEEAHALWLIGEPHHTLGCCVGLELKFLEHRSKEQVELNVGEGLANAIAATQGKWHRAQGGTGGLLGVLPALGAIGVGLGTAQRVPPSAVVDDQNVRPCAKHAPWRPRRFGRLGLTGLSAAIHPALCHPVPVHGLAVQSRRLVEGLTRPRTRVGCERVGDRHVMAEDARGAVRGHGVEAHGFAERMHELGDALGLGCSVKGRPHAVLHTFVLGEITQCPRGRVCGCVVAGDEKDDHVCLAVQLARVVRGDDAGHE